MANRYWLDLRRDLMAMGYSLQVCRAGYGMAWVGEEGVPLAVQEWDEPPRDFHWRTMRLVDDKQASNAAAAGPQEE